LVGHCRSWVGGLDVASHRGCFLGGGSCEVVDEAGEGGQSGPDGGLVGGGELVEGVADCV
jgi:hypothetical protein